MAEFNTSLCFDSCSNDGCCRHLLLFRIDFLFTPDSLVLLRIFLVRRWAYLLGFVLWGNEILKRSLLIRPYLSLVIWQQAFGLGTGIALFHLMTHAFFKALMFLGSGSVIHACHHEQDIFQYGGLRKRMPLRHILFSWSSCHFGVNFLSGYLARMLFCSVLTTRTCWSLYYYMLVH